MRLVNSYTIRPSEIQPGDVMILAVKAIVVRPGAYRLYRCAFPAKDLSDVPEGSRIRNEEMIGAELFRSLAIAADPDQL